MRKVNEVTPKERFIQAVTTFLLNARIYLLIALAALILFVVVFTIVSTVRSNQIERSTVLLERVERDVDSWMATEDEDERQRQADELLERLQSILDSYGSLYAGQRALFVRGSLYFQLERWESAAADFESLAARFPRSYLAPVSLINAAIAMEEAEEFQTAIDLYSRVLAQYANASPAIPTTIFALGRLHEAIEQPQTAIEFYESLADSYPGSGWTNLARSRIIRLNLD